MRCFLSHGDTNYAVSGGESSIVARAPRRYNDRLSNEGQKKLYRAEEATTQSRGVIGGVGGVFDAPPPESHERNHEPPLNKGRKKLNYRDAGVSVARGQRLVGRIDATVAETHNRGVLGGIGGFGGVFDAAALGYRDPLLVAGADGVGTKLMLANEMRRHDTIGVDLVAMCVNDVLVQGARPLFFLDYFACGALDVDTAGVVIEGIARGCRVADCALIGGETAEMPGFYPVGRYDLAGFCVGAVERGKLIDGAAAAAGDVLIGVASSGPHANGYSLIRALLERSGANLDAPLAGTAETLGEVLLEPTKIYAAAVRRLLEVCEVKSLCHVTGGGLTENLPRTLPAHLRAVVDTRTWTWPVVFTWLREQGAVELHEMYRTFNCGVGFVACVAAADVRCAVDALNDSDEQAWEIGAIEEKKADGKSVHYLG